jgi:teichuronic acid exporter
MLHVPRDPPPEPDAGHGQLKKGRARAALVGIVWAGVTSVVPAVVAGGVFAIASRYLTPGEFGLVALAASIALAAGALAPAGFGFALVQRQDIRKNHLDAVFWLCVGFGVAVYALLFAAAPLVANLFHEPDLALLLRVLGLRVLFDLAGVVPQSILARALRFDKLALRTAIATLVSAAVCLPLLAAGYGLWALVISQLASASASTIAAIVSVSWRPALSIDFSALRELSRYGIFASGHKVLQTINIDQILLGALLGTTPLGLFGFARRIFQLFNDLIAGTLNSVSYPLLSSLQDEPGKLRQAFLLAVFASSVLSFPIFVGMATVADDLVPVIFGAQWVEAVPALQGFCVIGVLSCIGVLQSSLITSRGHMDWWVYYQVAQQVATAALILVMYPFGITTLVFAMAAKTWLTFPLPMWKAGRILDIGIAALARPFAIPAVSCAVMVGAILLLRPVIAADEPALRLAGDILVGGSAYAIAILVLARHRLAEIRSLIPRRRGAT